MTRPDLDLTEQEQLIAAALGAERLEAPDFAQLARRAERRGTRTRRRRVAGAAVAAIAVVSVGLGLSAGAFDGPEDAGDPAASGRLATTSPAGPDETRDPTTTRTEPAITGGCRAYPPRRVEPGGPLIPSALEPDCDSPPRERPLDLDEAYATLDADGWSAPEDNVVADEKLYYLSRGDRSVSLNWRPASTHSAKWYDDEEPTAVIDGDPAWVLRDGGGLTVAGPVREGRFLTLTSTTLSERELVALAVSVRRQ